MKILFYSHFFSPETGAASVRAKYFVKALKKAGHEVFVVAPKPNYPIGKIFDGYDNKLIVKSGKENIIYLPILFVSSHSPVGRLISYLSYSIFSFFYLLFNNYKPEIVISSSPPIFTSFTALIYSKIKKSKFIFDIRDVWPDIGIELGILKSKIFINGLKKIEQILLNHSDKIIVTANGDKENVISKIDDDSKCEIIFNGADTDIFKPIDESKKEKIKKENNIPIDKLVLIYFGSYNYGMNDIDMMIKFLSDERIINKNIHFISIGSGDNLNKLLETIDGIITYNSYESLPSIDVAKFVGISDISIVPRKKIENDTGGNIPVKCYESWAAGIPVLISNIQDAEVTTIFHQCNGGVLVKPSNLEFLIDGFTELLHSKNKFSKHNMRDFVIDNYDRKNQTDTLLKIIDS